MPLTTTIPNGPDLGSPYDHESLLGAIRPSGVWPLTFSSTFDEFRFNIFDCLSTRTKVVTERVNTILHRFVSYKEDDNAKVDLIALHDDIELMDLYLLSLPCAVDSPIFIVPRCIYADRIGTYTDTDKPRFVLSRLELGYRKIELPTRKGEIQKAMVSFIEIDGSTMVGEETIRTYHSSFPLLLTVS